MKGKFSELHTLIEKYCKKYKEESQYREGEQYIFVSEYILELRKELLQKAKEKGFIENEVKDYILYYGCVMYGEEVI